MLTELSWIARETLSGYQSALSIWAFLAVSYFLISRNQHLGSIKKIMWNKKNADFSKFIHLFIQQIFDEHHVLGTVPGSEYFKCMLPCCKQ